MNENSPDFSDVGGKQMRDGVWSFGLTDAQIDQIENGYPRWSGHEIEYEPVKDISR